MNQALHYLLIKSTFGAIKRKLNQLKDPKYLIPAILTIAYFALILGPNIIQKGSPGLWPLLFHNVPCILAIAVGYFWGLEFTAGALDLKENEAELLFSAPLSRGDIILFDLIRGQANVFSIILVFTLFGGFTLKPPSIFFFMIGLFFIINFLRGIRFGITSFWGTISFLKQIPMRLVLTVPLISAAILSVGKPGTEPVLQTILTNYGIPVPTEFVAGILWPFRQIMALTQPPSDLNYIVGLLLTTLLPIASYVFAAKVSVAYEEATFDRQAKRKHLKERKVDRKKNSTKDQTTFLPLGVTGPAWRAIVWKSLLTSIRQGSLFILFLILIILIALTFLLTMTEFHQLQSAIGGISFLMGLFSFMSGAFLRLDFRSDLKNIEMLKTLPISAREMFFAQIMVTYIVSFLLQCMLFSVSIFNLLQAGDVTLAHVTTFTIPALIILPSLSASILVLENGLTLMMPAWFYFDQKKNGIENIGRTILTKLAYLLVLSMLVLVPGIIGTIIYFLLNLTLAAFVFSCLLGVEVFLIAGNIATFYEKLEPGSDELLG